MVFQPSFQEYFSKDYYLKKNWVRKVFNNENPLVLELGCGKGEYTVGLATKFPDINFIGIDIKGARMWKGAKFTHEKNLHNVAFLRTRIEFINSFFGEDEVNEIWLTFPDPQLKKDRKKKRLTGAIFLRKYQGLLRNGGIIHLKTDSEVLYADTLNILKINNIEILAGISDLYGSDIVNEILAIKTHYEKQYLNGGAKIHYLEFRLEKNKEIHEYPGEE